jgi:hypothetical protein
MTVGTTELANALGISRQRVNELGRMGKITREADGKWDLKKVHAQLGRRLDASQTRRARVRTPQPRATDVDPDGNGASGNVHEIFNRARAAKEIALAKREQLELRRREEELLERREVEQLWTTMLTAFKNRLLLAPDKLAPKVAVCSDVLECRAIIEREIRNMLLVFSESKDDA